MIVLIDSDNRIKGTKRAWELQKLRTHKGGQTWETYRWFTSFSSALEDAVHGEIRMHPAASLSEAIKAVSVIVQRYEQLIPSEYRIKQVTDQEDQYAADAEEPREPEEGGGVVDGGCIAVPDGEYELRYVFYETGMFFGSPKVIVHFAIVASDEYASLPVCRFYNAKKLTGPCGEFGAYIAPPRGDLAREYKRLVGGPNRTDRISFQALRGKRILACLEKVTRAYDWKALAPDDQYSRVAKLIRIIDDDFDA